MRLIPYLRFILAIATGYNFIASSITNNQYDDVVVTFTVTLFGLLIFPLYSIVFLKAFRN
jgi:hypothetical protein